tara:strand:+ start:6267 stop:8417 length:2151 start_codon:yes stop_codon:yes gene_type:complete
MFYIISSTIPVFLSAIITYYISINEDKIKVSKNFNSYFVLIWSTLFLSKFFLLGPYSPIHYYDNADIGLSRILFEKNSHLGGEYMHGILGGQDYYSTQLFGGQIISLEKILFSYLPLWIALLIHKSLLLLVGFIGAYLLFFKAYKFERIDVIFLASFITVFNPYTVYSTIHQGLSFSSIPLAIYIFLYTTEDKNYYFKVLCLSFLVSISTAPVHSFLAILGGIVMSTFLKKPENFIKYFFSILILLFVMILNWHESMFAMYELGPSSNRVYSAQNYFPILGSIGWLIEKTELCFISCNIQYSPAAILFLLSFFLLFYYKKFKYLFILLLLNYLPNIGIISINFLKIDILKSLNLFNYSFYLSIPIAYYILIIKKEIPNNFILKKVSLIFLFFSINYLIYYNFFYFKKIFYENQNKITSIDNLINKDWEPENKLYRVASTDPWNYFHPNFMWAYGLETIDGYVNIVDISFAKFWHNGIKKNKITEDKGIFYGGAFTITDRLKDREFIDLNKHIDLNLLKLVNTGYIASYTPIKNFDLKLVSGAVETNKFEKGEKRDINFYFNELSYLSKYIKKPKDILIYEISSFSERFFFPKKIKIINSNLDDFEKYRFISENYEKNITFSNKENIKKALGKISNSRKITNGYSLNAYVEKEGILILNSFYSPFWKVYINSKEGKLSNFADIHMGVELKIGTNEVKFIYDRPSLKDNVYEYLKKIL